MEDIQHANFWDSRIPTESTPYTNLKEDNKPGIDATAFSVAVNKEWFNNKTIILPEND